jgi:dolichyl-phosphate beta-glucosyltransferase
MDLSIIIPAFNEEKRLPAVLERITAHLQAREASWQVVVVDDGSEDATGAVAEEHEGVSVITHEMRLGRGAAVRTGMLGAYGDCRAWCDADGSVAPGALDQATARIAAGADVVAGSRALPGAQVSRTGQRGRLLADRIFQMRQRVLGLVNAPDALCPFQAWTAKACRRIFPLLRVRGHAGAAEALHAAGLHGLRIERVPVSWSNHAEHRIHPFTLLAAQSLDGIRVRVNSWRGRYR